MDEVNKHIEKYMCPSWEAEEQRMANTSETSSKA